MLRIPIRPRVYLFVLWSNARADQDRILTDLASRFTLLEVVEVVWSTDNTFARNLTRMYGDALPPGSDKETHCGNGPFLAVVVEDMRPRFQIRHTGRGVKFQNSSVFDARRRYRTWTGGGYRVHASDSASETERNLVLILGKRTAEFIGGRPAADALRRHEADPIGTDGWTSVEQLLLALEVYGGELTGRSNAGLTVRARDLWWAEHIAGGRELSPGVWEVRVAEQPLMLTLVEKPPTRADRSAVNIRRFSRRCKSAVRRLKRIVHNSRPGNAPPADADGNGLHE